MSEQNTPPKPLEGKLKLYEVQRALKNIEKELRIKFVSLTKREKDMLMKTVKLQEEVGELANDVLSVLALQRRSKLDQFKMANLYEEFADVILATSSLANVLRVDLNRAVKEKLAKLSEVYVKDK